jgi:hypothetical protein
MSCRYRMLEKDGNFSEFGIKEFGKCFIQNKGSVIQRNNIMYKWLTNNQLTLTIAPNEQFFLIIVQGDSLKLEERTLEKNKIN